MGSFKRAFLGYRRADVDAAIATRDQQIGELQRQLDAAAEAEAELRSLSGMVIEREREIRVLREELSAAAARHDRSVASLEALSLRMEEMQAQARGQATRIRMKALREAAEVTMRAGELAAAPAAQNGSAPPVNGNATELPRPDLFQGRVRVEIGPLDDFAQLVGFEDAAGRIDATSEISVERFSEGRATLSMHLDEPIELLRELEECSPLEFRVRHTGGDNVILDLDDDAPGREAA